jgi:pilus assembly protein Flp/PilA
MCWLVRLICALRREDTGASLPEYALLLALITIVCLAAVTTLGNGISSFLTGLAASV